MKGDGVENKPLDAEKVLPNTSGCATDHGSVQLHNGQEILHELSIPRAIAQAGGDIRAASHAE